MEYAQVVRVTHPDQILVERCRARDEGAFGEIVARYKSKIYNYVFRMTGDSEDAEDLTQEVFLRLYTSLESFRQQSSLHTWLFRIAGNLCIDRFRRRRRHGAAAYSLDSPVGSEESDAAEAQRDVPDSRYEPQQVLERVELTDRIQDALLGLPDKLRTVVVLYDIEGLPYEEIAQIVSCPVGTVKSRLFNARQQMRRRLTAYLRE